METENQPRLVKGVAAEQYAQWRQSPAGKMFRAFLSDYAKRLEFEALQRWRAGSLVLADEHDIRHRIVQIAEIAALSFDAIAEFYDVPEQATEPENEDV